ncbi:hypothetical protein Q8A67_002419 [Cirrhinus molitorella]|uniref:Uncharacterized protein n=1 Tax=Cirrhinus molitorella TaxID=172907 RepID=A0AA88TZC6_9TELE|nr:hypothetical protein Q8A67_002419 [Cirrhinus molitorella]
MEACSPRLNALSALDPWQTDMNIKANSMGKCRFERERRGGGRGGSIYLRGEEMRVCKRQGQDQQTVKEMACISY